MTIIPKTVSHFFVPKQNDTVNEPVSLSDFPDELIAHIFSLLDLRSLSSVSMVNKKFHAVALTRWRQLAKSSTPMPIKDWHLIERRAKSESGQKVLEVLTSPRIFGVEAWKRYVKVDVGDDPPLLPFVKTLLTQNDYYFKEPFIKNYSLVLVPSSIDGKPFNIKRWKKKSFRVLLPKHEIAPQDWRDMYNKAPADSHWVLMPKRPLPVKSRCSIQEITYMLDSANEFVKSVSDIEITYELPTYLEVLASTITQYFQDNQFPFENGEISLILCDPQDFRGRYSVLVGNSSKRGKLFRKILMLGLANTSVYMFPTNTDHQFIFAPVIRLKIPQKNN